MELTIGDTNININQHKLEFNAEGIFPHIIIDNALPIDFAEGLLFEANKSESAKKSNDYLFARNKFEDSNLDRVGPFGAAFKRFMLSEEFNAALSQICGINLFVDPEFIGGGIHRGGKNSYLDMHVDFGRHPTNKNWVRELNILYYLNRNWKKPYGGSLDLKNKNTGAEASIEPLFNRMVIMLTKDYTIHGYKKINFPNNEYRTSFAAYAYSIKPESAMTNLKSTTVWFPESGLSKKIISRLTPGLVMLKRKFFGSSTAKKK